MDHSCTIERLYQKEVHYFLLVSWKKSMSGFLAFLLLLLFICLFCQNVQKILKPIMEVLYMPRPKPGVFCISGTLLKVGSGPEKCPFQETGISSCLNTQELFTMGFMQPFIVQSSLGLLVLPYAQLPCKLCAFSL